MIHSQSSQFRILLYGFLDPISEKRITTESESIRNVENQYWLNEDEINALKSPIELPLDLIEKFNYNDSMSAGSFTIYFTKQADPSGDIDFTDKDFRGLRLWNILDEGSIISFQLKEAGKSVYGRLFSGYVTNIKNQSSANGTDTLVVSGLGLEAAIESQTTFIDSSKRPDDIAELKVSDKEQTEEEKDKVFSAVVAKIKEFKKNKKSRLEIVLNALFSIAIEFSSSSKAVSRIAEIAIAVLLSEGRFGGKEYNDLLDYKNAISKDTYSEGFIHVLSFLSNPSFGNKFGFWSMMETFNSAPLYDLFLHYNEFVDLYIDKSKSITESDWVFDNDKLSFLVYRKNPFRFLDEENGKEIGLIAKIFESQIKNYSFHSQLSEIFTGVYVVPSILDARNSYFMNPVLYNPALVRKYGTKIFEIKLDGVKVKSTENGEDTKETKIAIKKLKEARNLIAKTFGHGDRIVSGTISIDFTPSICKGQILKIVDENGGEELHPSLMKYKNQFFIQGTKVEVNPATGTANMTLEVKWGAKRSRFQTDRDFLIEDTTNDVQSINTPQTKINKSPTRPPREQEK